MKNLSYAWSFCSSRSTTQLCKDHQKQTKIKETSIFKITWFSPPPSCYKTTLSHLKNQNKIHLQGAFDDSSLTSIRFQVSNMTLRRGLHNRCLSVLLWSPWIFHHSKRQTPDENDILTNWKENRKIFPLKKNDPNYVLPSIWWNHWMSTWLFLQKSGSWVDGFYHQFLTSKRWYTKPTTKGHHLLRPLWWGHSQWLTSQPNPGPGEECTKKKQGFDNEAVSGGGTFRAGDSHGW